jgi:hypothetical protein
MEILWFPFDKQTCQIEFGTPTYPKNIIQYFGYDVSKNKFTEHKIWSLTSYNFSIVDFKFEGYDLYYSLFNVILTVKRKPLFVITNLMLPALFLSSITLISFYVPFPQAMPIGISILLAYSVLTIRFAS